MDISYKVLVSFLAILILIVGGFALTNGISKEIEINNYFETISQTIAESDYNSDVIELCIEDAKENGFTLEVEIYDGGMYGSMKYAQVKLSYKSAITLFGVSFDRVKQKVI